MKKILLIEDNLDVRETTQELLELADYKVIAAKNGKEGVELAKAESPDVIVCDIMMPNLDGYGVLRILSRNPGTSTIPFIFLTAKAEKTDVRKGMNLGADDYVTKPFEEMDLIDAIETRLKKSEGLKNGNSTTLNGLNEFLDKAKGAEELMNLSENRQVKTFKRKESIYREDDHANYLYYIVEGSVKCSRSDNYGKSYVHEVHGPGEFLGYMSLLKNGTYDELATALDAVQFAVIPKDDFRSLISKNRDVSANYIKLLSKDVIEREKRLLQLAYAPMRERLADTLLKLCSKACQNGTVDKLDISRQDLANMVGAAKESLIRTLSELKKEGLLDTDGQQIKILDSKGLERTAIGF